MTVDRFVLVLVPLLVAASPSQAQLFDQLSPKAIDQTPGAEQLPVGEGGPPAPPIETGPSPPSSPAQIDAWRADLVGKAAFGPEGGRIGTVAELSVSLDDRVTAAVVELPSGARLPVPWKWVESQVGRSTVVVPWSAADIAWLQGARAQR